MTLDSAKVDLSKTFEVGQGYVALSRVKNIEGLQLLGLNSMALRVDPLILRIDEPIKKASQRATEKIESYSKKQLEKAHKNYIRGLGGLTSFVHIEEEKRQLRAEKLSKIDKSKPTHIKTKALLGNCKTIKEIAKTRGLTEGTIITHLAKLKDEDSNIDLEKFRPHIKHFKYIEEAVYALKRRNRPEDFSDDGKLRTKSIFNYLEQIISYDNIRFAMLFI